MTAATVPETPTSALFANLTDYGWVRLETGGVKHWGQDNKLLCGLKPSPELHDVLSREPLSYSDQIGACKKCVSELIRRTYALPFRIGQRVTSRAHGMPLNGRIERFFLFSDNQPALDITREWASKPEEMTRSGHDVFENDTHPGDWYRYAHECRALEEHPMTQTTTKTKKASARNAPAEAQMDKAKFKDMARETRAKMQMSSKPRVKGKKADAVAAEDLPTTQADHDVYTRFNTGSYVTTRIDGEEASGFVREVHYSSGILTVEFPSGEKQGVNAKFCEPNARLPRVSIRPGDTVQSDDQTTWKGSFVVLSVNGPDVVVQVPDAGTRLFQYGNLLVSGRAKLKDAERDFQIRPLAPNEIPQAVSEAEETNVPAPELTPVDVVPVSVAPLGDPLTPGTLGMHAVPLTQLVRSGCNVRRHYDPNTIQEMAASLKAEGQIENATGRWNDQGQVEIVAGESRRRAQVLREEAGELGLTLLVNIRTLDDAEALAISATENMRRKNMTGLEECEAMMRLNDAGRSIEDVAAMFGFETLKPVADRVLVARNLHTKGRDALDSGEMSLACAFVIARAAGADVQNSMVQQATSSHNRATATQLAAQLTKGQVLVRHAKFNVEKSGLAIKRDLFDVYEAFFEDKPAALNAQIAWAQGRAEKLREGGKHAFVHVVTDNHFYRYSAPYDGTELSKGKGGFVFVVSPSDGAVTEEHDLRLKPNKQVKAAPDDSGRTESAGAQREMPDSAFLEAHVLRARAARAAIVGDTHLTLALTVWGLILGNNSDVGRISVGQLSGIGAKELIPPELQARRDALQQALTRAPGVSRASDHVYLAAFSHSGVQADPHKLLELLVGLTDEELLGHLNTLTALVAYNWSAYHNKNAPAAEYVYLAGLTGAPARLAQDFILTDEWLRRYPRHELVALAEEAGLGRALVEDAKTLKEMRARILEHAAKLHGEGFVPRLVRFPKAGKA